MSVSIKEELDGSEFRESETIAFDIETEGFAGANGDEVTVIGLYPDSSEDTPVFLINTKGKDIDKRELWENCNDFPMAAKVVVYETECTLLDVGFRSFIESLNTYDQRLCGYNAETWSGGFDIPFLRTRFMNHSIEWYLDGVYYVDILTEVQKHINTVEPLFKTLSEDEQEQFKEEFNYSDEDIIAEDITDNLESFGETTGYNVYGDNNGLDEAHEVLCDCGVDDPYESSKQAVEDYENGVIAPVIYHCYTDVVRTKCMFDLVMAYTPAREPSELKDSGYI
ncbi:hypothetical protein [Methanohalobium sp.]|uniref:hypothetical protein n=1 Tax=Methanohalobium sp. TaxID=2837493 RepID=UPI0025DBDDB6|nr:hypothetical protein [Methanohalobium sp.]